MGDSRKAQITVMAAFVVFVVAVVAGSALNGVHAQMQEDQALADTGALSSYAEFQFATLTGTNNTINATMVPVVTPSGTTYKNLTFTVNVATNGAITIAPGSPTAVATPATQT